MKLMTKLGLAVVAALALAVAVSANAFAALPEFSPANGAFTVKSGSGTLKAGNVTITCTSDKGSGEITGAKEGKGTVTFEGCTGKTGSEASCSVHSPSSANGVITTVELVAKLGYLKASEKKVGLKFSPKSGTTFTEIESESGKSCVVKTKVTESIINELTPVNTLTSKFEDIFRESKEKQEWRKFEGEETVSELKAFGSAARLVSTEIFELGASHEIKA